MDYIKMLREDTLKNMREKFLKNTPRMPRIWSLIYQKHNKNWRIV